LKVLEKQEKNESVRKVLGKLIDSSQIDKMVKVLIEGS